MNALHPHRPLRHHIAVGLLCMAVLRLPAHASNIITDGTVGPAQNLSGPDFVIPQDLGARHGANLFHSFQRFTIDQDQSATFTGSQDIQNVISRVTGGEASHIHGRLHSQIGQADFYFINPAGVMFGPEAVVDVPAGFHVSTAASLEFADGNSFHALHPERSTLTQAPPEAFGFMDAQAVAIHIDGSRFEFNPDSGVSLVSSGDIHITGTETNLARLHSPGGTLELSAQGDIVLNRAEINSSGDGGGHIQVNGRNARLHDARVVADNTGARHAEGGITLTVDGLLEVLRVAYISSNTNALGDAGNVTVTAGAARFDRDGVVELLLNGLTSNANSGSSGNAGTVTLTVAGLLEVLRGATISSGTFASGDAGNVTVTAGTARFDDGAVLSTRALYSTGNAGTVTLTVAGLLEVLRGAQISSSTFARGDAGNVTVTAGAARFDRDGAGQFTGLTSNANSGSTGNAGTVTLTVEGLLEVLRGAAINSSTFALGDAGNVSVTAGAARFDGHGASQFTDLASNANRDSSGNAGTVTLTVEGLLEVLRGAQISSSTWASGNAGNVTVTAGAARFDRDGADQVTGLFSQANSGTGNAGTVTLTVDGLLEVLRGAAINSSTFALGDAGNVTVTAGAARFDRDGAGQLTGLASNANSGSSGHAGTVTLTVDGLLEVLRGATISSSTFASGNAGNVTVTAGAARFDRDGADYFTGLGSQAESGSSGHAGSITLTVEGLLEVLHRATISSGTGASGDAGDVNIHTGRLFAQDANIGSLAGTNATGAVGRVAITADRIQLNDDSLISIASRNPNAQPPADDSTREPPSLYIQAKTLHLNNSEIGAQSQGQVPAAPIVILAKQVAVKEGSRITTSAQNADGGSISVLSHVIHLQDGLITTSVEDQRGDGGNITLAGYRSDLATQALNADAFLIMQGGFIQANTAATDARGGDIIIQVHGILQDPHAELRIGSSVPEVFTPGGHINIIQAAAPQGNPGDIPNIPIRLDLASALAPTQTYEMIPLAMAEDYCRLLGTPWASTLVPLGRGGLPEEPGKPLLLFLTPEQLNELLHNVSKPPERGAPLRINT